MGINKVQINRNGQTETIIDLTQDTVTEETLLDGVIAHGADGEPIIGTFAPKLQDKVITENGTYSADSGFDGLGSVTVEVESGLEGLENGYDVMFYDENNEGLAFYSIKQGHSINAPIYECKKWKTAEEMIIQFPFTPTGDLIVYADNSSVANEIYQHFGVDKVVYPYIFLHQYYAYQIITFCHTVTVYENGNGLSSSNALFQNIKGTTLDVNSDNFYTELYNKIISMTPNLKEVANYNQMSTSAIYTNTDEFADKGLINIENL